MGTTRPPGPTTPSLGPYSIPPRTPGPLGINDQGDPNVTTLLGDTPGPTGWLDGGDPALPLFSIFERATYPVCRADDGAPLSIGFDLQAPPTPPTATVDEITLTDAQEIALKITTEFEGGKSMNYQALADDFDGQGTSFGLIQWNFGKNTLGPLLKKMLDADATAFKGCFGEDADYDTIEKAIKDGKKDDQLKWARDRIKNKRSAWKSAFEKLGEVEAFKKIQREQAAAEYHPKVVTAIEKIREMTDTLFTDVELRSYAALFDLCVQQGSIAKAETEIEKRVKDEKPTTQLALMEIVVTERALKASSEWASDCLSRRMGILTGAAYKSTENDVTKTRTNTQFSLLTQSGDKIVTDL
jgi:hypothetical protein